MRIVGGDWRGRVLAVPDGTATRPSSERLREGLFNVLAHAPWAEPHRIANRSVLDAFAGTGALGLEALSRGASTVVFMENAAAALGALQRNIVHCDATARSTVLVADVMRAPNADRPVDLALLDPPYADPSVAQALDRLVDAGWIGADTLVVVEAARNVPEPARGTILDRRRYGAAALFFLRF